MTFCELLAAATHLITIFGVPTAVILFLKEQRMFRHEREYGTYDALDNKYIELQELCLQHPSLDVFDTPYESPQELSPEQKKQEEAILLIRISIFERAYMMYRRSSHPGRNEQWAGWEMEIREWFDRRNFLECWIEHSPYFDQEFVRKFEKIAKERQKARS